ncbi:MAG: hypothetical protein WBA16_03565 [Nonlabens sp.]
MMRFLLLVLCVITTQIAAAQLEVSKYSIDKIKKSALPVHYTGNDSLLNTLIIERGQLRHLRRDINLQVVEDIVLKMPRLGNFEEFITTIVNEDHSVSLIFANSRKSKFAQLKYDPINGRVALEKSAFELKKETYLHGLTYNRKFYILSLNLQRQLVLHEIEKGAENDQTVFPTQDYEYHPYSSSNSQFIHKALKTKSQRSIGYTTLQVLEEDLPNSIEQVSTSSKLLVKGGSLILSIDLDRKRTDVFTISLEDKTMSIKSYDHAVDGLNEDGTFKSNSYLHEGLLYQVAVSSERMLFKVTDAETSEKLKMLTVNKQDSIIPFANTPITQLGGAYANYRELDKPKQLLRKMKNSNPGISVHRVNNELEVTIGGTKEAENAGLFIAGVVMGAATGVMLGGNNNMDFGYYSNPYFMSYNAGVNSKSVYIISLFDGNLQHLDVEVVDNIWDKIDLYTDNIKPFQVDIFNHRDTIYYSYYNRKTDEYILVRF